MLGSALYSPSAQTLRSWFDTLVLCTNEIPQEHSDGANYLFVDGHVKWILDPDATGTGFWTPSGGD
ncbi:hypothetical protein KAW50_08810 [candidate division WOR-3 bacterium]|nr:hypothetical protein [candidate division WOR-3 bacterium]